MGLDCYSIIIIGEKILIKDIKQKVIRYDEITGKSFQKEIYHEKWFYENGDEFDNELLESEDEQDFIFSTYCDGHIKYIGLKLCKTCSHRLDEPATEIDLTNIENLRIQYFEKYKRRAKTFLITVISYKMRKYDI